MTCDSNITKVLKTKRHRYIISQSYVRGSMLKHENAYPQTLAIFFAGTLADCE